MSEGEALMSAREQPAAWGVYVHVPWCRRRCVYCDFVLDVGKPDLRFVPALLKEAELRRESQPQNNAQSLYLGGGTPTHLGAEALEKLVMGLQERLQFEDGFECTVEANPEDLSPSLIAALERAGVNRLSIGLQSFDDDVLKTLGRKHRRKDALLAVERSASFERVSVDLIIGVPGFSKERLDDDLKRLIDLGVGHISTYMLTVEPETTLHKLVKLKKRDDVDEDHQADEYERVQSVLFDAGFRQYEISSFAQPGHESRHNRLYWGKGSWLGLGPGAHSLERTVDGGHLRKSQHNDVNVWIERPLELEEEYLAGPLALVDSLAFGLRDLLSGVDMSQLEHRNGCCFSKKTLHVLQQECEVGNLTHKGGKFFLSPQGVLFADAIARRILATS